jgi:SAM-dependent methyltransferase
MGNRLAYEKAQTSAFSALVKDGTYSDDFDHGKPSQQFFRGVMSDAMSALSSNLKNDIRVIDCGCGNGAWLDYLTSIDAKGNIASVHGFDLTPEMVSVARTRLDKKGIVSHLQDGNVLESSSYDFQGSEGDFDLVFTYDVIQQLPSKIQFEACQKIVDQLANGGIAVIFDNVRWRARNF